jgi:NAD(P)H-nitrite reductase large subunit
MTMKHVIVGGGIAAVSAVRAIREYAPDSHITVISEEKHCFYYRPMTPLIIKGDKERDDLLHDYESLDIHLIHGRAASLDHGSKKIVLQNDDRIAYDRLLIATGSSPLIPPIKGITEPNVHYLRTMADAQGIKEAAKSATHAVIIGGGFVGTKKAEALAHLGIKVTMVEKENHILLPRLDETGAALITERLTGKGVELVLNDTVTEILPDTKGVKLDSGRDLACDFVCVTVGVKPNIEWLAGSGIETEKAILVNETMQTNLDGVYAAGDIVQIKDLVTGQAVVSALWTNAVEMGKVAGACMAGGKIKYPGGMGVLNSSEIAGLPIVSVGLVLPEGLNGYQVFRKQGPQSYRKLILKGDVLAGAIFIGDIENAGLYTALIKTGRPLGALKEKLLSGTINYADYYLNR